MKANLDGLIGVCYKSDEEAEHHVDEEGDEGVEVKPAEQPHHVALVSHLQEGVVHVVPVDQREEALGHLVQRTELEKNICNISVSPAQSSLMCVWIY